MRGKPKTPIVLTIVRKGEQKPIELTLTREVIKVQSVKSKVAEPGIGYLRITQFQEQTTADVVRHLEKMYKQGALKGLILDLRNDPGGLLNAAVGVSATFLPQKSLVVIRTDAPRMRNASTSLQRKTMHVVLARMC